MEVNSIFHYLNDAYLTFVNFDDIRVGYEHLMEETYEYSKSIDIDPATKYMFDLNDINSPYDSHLHLGSGELDFRQIFDMIPDGSYVTFETIKDSKENLNDFIGDMEWLKKFQ